MERFDKIMVTYFVVGYCLDNFKLSGIFRGLIFGNIYQSGTMKFNSHFKFRKLHTCPYKSFDRPFK